MNNSYEMTSKEYKIFLENKWEQNMIDKQNEYNAKVKKLRSEAKKKLLYTQMFGYGQTMTKDEFVNEYLQWHKDNVELAIARGYEVPNHVLNEYNLG